MVLLDACVRLLPGVMGAAESAEEESFAAGLLEYPHYTRPAEWQGRRVPEVLLSGHHAAIAAWRRAGRPNASPASAGPICGPPARQTMPREPVASAPARPRDKRKDHSP